MSEKTNTSTNSGRILHEYQKSYLDWPPRQNYTNPTKNSTMQKRNMSKKKNASTQRQNSSCISEIYLPLPSHISQSGHLTGAFGGQAASSTGVVELSVDSERNSGLIAYCLEIGSTVKPEDDPTRKATAAKSIRENETGFIMVEKQNRCEKVVGCEL